MIQPKEKDTSTSKELARDGDSLMPCNKESEEYIEENDGSGSAFEATERVTEDNFDDLREK